MTAPQEPRERWEELYRDLLEAHGEEMGADPALEAACRRIAELERALAFAQCTIKSGEPWTETCEQVIGRALGGKP